MNDITLFLASGKHVYQADVVVDFLLIVISVF